VERGHCNFVSSGSGSCAKANSTLEVANSLVKILVFVDEEEQHTATCTEMHDSSSCLLGTHWGHWWQAKRVCKIRDQDFVFQNFQSLVKTPN
jgi:hypothetical protein